MTPWPLFRTPISGLFSYSNQDNSKSLRDENLKISNFTKFDDEDFKNQGPEIHSWPWFQTLISGLFSFSNQDNSKRFRDENLKISTYTNSMVRISKIKASKSGRAHTEPKMEPFQIKVIFSTQTNSRSLNSKIRVLKLQLKVKNSFGIK